MAESPSSIHPISVFIAGPNGAGKTTLLPHLLLMRDLRVGVNLVPALADEFASALVADGVPEAIANIRAGRLVIRQIDQLIQNKVSFVHETNLVGTFASRVINRGRAEGYKSFVAFIALDDPELAVARVEARVRQGGHDVPADVIRVRWQRGLTLFFDRYLSLADEWAFYDNSRGAYEIASGGDGRIWEVVDPEKWAWYQDVASSAILDDSGRRGSEESS